MPAWLSTGWPRIRQPQCSHAGAIMWMAHSKLSNVPVWFPILTVNMRPSLLPQTSHAPMVLASCCTRVLQTLKLTSGAGSPPRGEGPPALDAATAAPGRVHAQGRGATLPAKYLRFIPIHPGRRSELQLQE